jgi:hypothetical protein
LGRKANDIFAQRQTFALHLAKTLDKAVRVVQRKGIDGDLPKAKSFGRQVRFWKLIGMATLIGLVMGCLGLGIINVISKVTTSWTMAEFDDPNNAKYNQGHLHWLYVPTIAGFGVGKSQYDYVYMYIFLCFMYLYSWQC